MENPRPAAQRIELPHGLRPGIYDFDRDEVTKSVPDLLDSKYVAFRRPWYGNPNYRGPKNVILSNNQLNSPGGNLYNVKSVQTLHRNEYADISKDATRPMNYHSIVRERPRRRKNTTPSVTESEPMESFFSFATLMPDKQSNRLSSPPDSVFSAQNRSRCSSENRNLVKRQNRSKTDHRSSRHASSDVVEEQILPRHISKQTRSPFDNRYNDGSISNEAKIDQRPDVTEVIVRDSNRENKCHSQRCLDNRMLKLWKQNTNTQSDDSDLTSVTDDDMSNSSTPSKGSYYRPLPLTDQGVCEALFYIFTFLDMKSLAKCGRVNRQWRNVSREPILWRKFQMNDCLISPSTFSRMSKWCIEIKEVNLQKLSTAAKVTQPRSNSDCDINVIEASLVTLLNVNKESLKAVKIIDCDKILTNRIIWSISTICSNLTKIVYLSKEYPLGQQDLYPLGRGCPAITSMIVPPGWPCSAPSVFNDACCEAISNCWGNIKILCIGGRNLTNVGLQHIAKGCIKLQHLEIDHGPEITEDISSNMIAAGLRGLQKLNFTFTPISPRAVVIFNNACPKLNHIGIHCSIVDYFPDHKSDRSKENYESLKTIFRKLQNRSGFHKVLDIDLDY